jgi:arylsulfatase A-like enzyme
LRAVDDALASLFSGLERRGLLANTVIVVFADHGECLYEGGRSLGHGDTLRGSEALVTPLIVVTPQGLGAGKRLTKPIRNIDIAPTLAELLTNDKIPDSDGISLVTALNGAAIPDLPVYSETGLWFNKLVDQWLAQNRMAYPDVTELLYYDRVHDDDLVIKKAYEKVVVAAKHRMLIRYPYKLIYVPQRDGVRLYLFDIERDPLEQNDLAPSEPDIVANLFKELSELVAAGGRDFLHAGYILPKPYDEKAASAASKP